MRVDKDRAAETPSRGTSIALMLTSVGSLPDDAEPCDASGTLAATTAATTPGAHLGSIFDGPWAMRDVLAAAARFGRGRTSDPSHYGSSSVCFHRMHRSTATSASEGSARRRERRSALICTRAFLRAALSSSRRSARRWITGQGGGRPPTPEGEARATEPGPRGMPDALP